MMMTMTMTMTMTMKYFFISHNHEGNTCTSRNVDNNIYQHGYARRLYIKRILRSRECSHLNDGQRDGNMINDVFQMSVQHFTKM